jgi:hypothetical protein
MSKGIASRHSLKALAYPLQQFLAGWGARERPSKPQGDGADLPAPYALAALRGEAVLRQRFFKQFMEKLPVQLDAEQQIALWQSLVEEGGQITAWVQRLGIAKALRREASIPTDAAKASRQLYCLLLDALAQESPDLLAWAVDAYFWHCWKSRFPDAITVDASKEKKEPEILRERLIRALRKHYQETVELKESFQQTPDSVHFALLVKRASTGQWEGLIQLDRPRLKTARLAAYTQYLKQISTV